MRVGILGGGQLGQMMAAAAQPLGIRVDCFDAAPDVPASLTGTVTVGDLNDVEAVVAWARTVDVVTYEFENLPADVVAAVAEVTKLAPNVRALAAAQDRWQEKRLFERLGIPLAPFRLCRTPDDLMLSMGELGLPLVAKTRTGGYDGKGQVVIRSEADVPAALELMRTHEVVVEGFVAFQSECSIIGVRSADGEVRTYPLSRNVHREGILRLSTPTSYPDHIKGAATSMMQTLLEHLDYAGVLALELFEVDGEVIANEMAPRVHNSGHWTIEGARTSQFENHVRAVCGLPLGSTEMWRPTAMINLIGTVPGTRDVLAIDGAHLHLYGKEPRPGRKLGHVTVTGDSEEDLAMAVKAVEALL